MKNYIGCAKFILVQVKKAYNSGDVVVVGDLIGVAAHDVIEGAKVSLSTQGIFSLPKNKGEVLSVGDSVYVKNGLITKDKKEAVFCGIIVEDSSQDLDSCSVRLV